MKGQTITFPDKEAVSRLVDQFRERDIPATKRENSLRQLKAVIRLFAAVALAAAVASFVHPVAGFVTLAIGSIFVGFNDFGSHSANLERRRVIDEAVSGTIVYRSVETAPLSRRVVAECLDVLISAAAGSILAASLIEMASAEIKWSDGSIGIAIVTYILMPVLPGVNGGAGKRIMRISARGADGTQPSWVFFLRRDVFVKRLAFVLLTVPSLGLVPLADLVAAARDSQGRSLHDRILDTRVLVDQRVPHAVAPGVGA